MSCCVIPLLKSRVNLSRHSSAALQVERITVVNRDTARVFVKGPMDSVDLGGAPRGAGHVDMGTRQEVSFDFCVRC